VTVSEEASGKPPKSAKIVGLTKDGYLLAVDTQNDKVKYELYPNQTSLSLFDNNLLIRKQLRI
jgi:hypothetical protein